MCYFEFQMINDLKIKCIFPKIKWQRAFFISMQSCSTYCVMHGLSTSMGTGPPYKKRGGGRVHMHGDGSTISKWGWGVPCDAPAVTFAPLTNISRCTATWENSDFYQPCALCLRSVAILLSPSILPEAHRRINHWPSDWTKPFPFEMI